MQHARRLSALVLLLAAPSLAQTYRVLPAGYETVWAGNNGTGYATQNGISQNLYIAPCAAGTSVQTPRSSCRGRS